MGGWTNTKTQNTILTPELVKAVIEDKFLAKYPHSFMGYILAHAKNGLLLPKFEGLLGSTAYLYQDLHSTRPVVYGDIDVLMVVEELIQTEESDREHENRCIEYGRKLIHHWATECPFTESVNEGRSIIIEIKNDTGIFGGKYDYEEYVQLDMMYTLPRYKKWYIDRFTPHHGTKGFVTTALFTAFYDVLKIMIGDRGVILRLKDGEPVSYNHRKNVDIITLSTDYTNMFCDMISHFSKSNKFVCTVKGLKRGESFWEMLEDFWMFFRDLARNGILGESKVFHKYHPEQLLEDLIFQYIKIVKQKLQNSKFDKRETDLAFKAYEKYQISGQLAMRDAKLFLEMKKVDIYHKNTFD